MMKRWMTLLLTVIMIALFGSAVSASDQMALRVNNEIVTNHGQPFHVVVEFGNRTQAMMHDVSLQCVWGDFIGTNVRVFNNPFGAIDSFDTSGLQFVRSSNSMSINPGQNYNFSFAVRTTAQAGQSDVMACRLDATGADGASVTLFSNTLIRVQ